MKVLGQISPPSRVLAAVYRVPEDRTAIVSSIVVCNRSRTTDAEFRVSVAIGGTEDAEAQYLYCDVPLDAQDTFVASLGVTLGQGDVVRCYSSTGTLSFSLFGQEVS